MAMILKSIVSQEFGGLRLDEAVSALFAALSKSEARRIIDRGGCSLNNAMVRVASRCVKAGDIIEVGVMEPGRFCELQLPPEAVLYEDDNLLAVNKPAGINSQRTPYQLRGTLEFWVGEYFRLHGIQEPARVVHRLDRGTSGVMIFPKNKQAAAWLSLRFHDGQVKKRYLAIVSGTPSTDAWSVDGAIGKVGSARYGIVPGGRTALTEFRLLETSGGYVLLEARPLTGRTHQIRVHLQASGLPIVGDATYGGVPAARMMLHCAALAFPDDRGAAITISAPPDETFTALMGPAGAGAS